MNGHMAEAQKGFATLEDVEYGTFVRFIEWAHRGYYTAAKFKTVKTESPCTPRSQSHDEVVSASKEDYDDEAAPTAEAIYDEETPPQAEPLRALDSWSLGKKKKEKKDAPELWGSEVGDHGWGTSTKGKTRKKKRELKEAFISRKYSARNSVFVVPPPRPNQDPEEDYTDVFLSHAQLYVLAEKYDIQTLKYFALEELHATLAIYTLYPRRTGDIIALLRYVYGNTGQSNGGEEELRQVLTAYIGYEMDTLMDDEDFRDLMIEDGGPLLGEFMTMVGRRIS